MWLCEINYFRSSEVHPSADCVVGWTTLSASRPGPLGDGDSGDCDPYWPAENGQVATTQSADGCTCAVTREVYFLFIYLI